MQQRLHWLDYDPVAFAVLVTGMGMIALLAFSIWACQNPATAHRGGVSLGRSVGRPLSLHNPQIRIFDPAIKSVALLLPQKLPSHARGVFTKLEALGAEQILIRVEGVRIWSPALTETRPGRVERR
jgi:hypothetical protein